ncbi:MAG: DNA-3-methyladenine glycosylase family protein [Gaiella sp.]
MLEAIVIPRGPYRLSLMTRGRMWEAPQPGGTVARAYQRRDGAVVIQAADEEGLALARFQLALDDDTSEFHARFGRDPLVGPSVRTFKGWRPLRVATVARAAISGFCGQLVDTRTARMLERGVLARCGTPTPTCGDVASLAPAELARMGLAQRRATALVHLCRTLDLERLRGLEAEAVRARLLREPQLGPWTLGVIATDGLGLYAFGPAGDLGLVKLVTALTGRVASTEDTQEFLASYGEWQALAGNMLMLGWGRGLVPGAHPDRARLVRVRARRAA